MVVGARLFRRSVEFVYNKRMGEIVFVLATKETAYRGDPSQPKTLGRVYTGNSAVMFSNRNIITARYCLRATDNSHLRNKHAL